MVDRALQHALETERGLRIALVVRRQYGHGLGDDRAQVASELADVGVAGAQNRGGRRIFQEREQ